MELIRLVFQLLALVTALTSAIGVTLIVKGMKSSKPVIAAFYSLTIQAIILTVIFFMSTHQLNLVAVGFFSLGGILSLGIARVLNFNAMRMLGASKTSAIIGSSPVIATVLSIIVLSESLNLAIFLGAATVTLGIVFISEATGFKIEKGLLSGLASAFAYALGNIINKFGIFHQPDPLISAQVGTVAGLLFTTVFIFYTGQFSYLNVKKSSLIYFTLTGILSSVGWITMMKSLETGSVSAITTIVYSYPLFAIFFTRLFVRDERITVRTIIGAILIVAGVTVVTIF